MPSTGSRWHPNTLACVTYYPIMLNLLDFRMVLHQNSTLRTSPTIEFKRN